MRILVSLILSVLKLNLTCKRIFPHMNTRSTWCFSSGREQPVYCYSGLQKRSWDKVVKFKYQLYFHHCTVWVKRKNRRGVCYDFLCNAYGSKTLILISKWKNESSLKKQYFLWSLSSMLYSSSETGLWVLYVISNYKGFSGSNCK